MDGKPLSAPLYILKGAAFVWEHRRVMGKYAAAPVAIGTLLMGCAYWLLYHYFFRFVGTYAQGEWYKQIAYYLLLVAVTVLAVVVFFFLFTRVASALAAPFNDVISQRTEELVHSGFEESSFSLRLLMKDSSRAIGHSFRILGLYVVMLLAGLPLLLLPGIGALLFTVYSALLSSYMFAYEYLGYPMDRRRYSFADKRRFLRSRLVSAIGFGLGSLAAASIPVVNMLFIPAAVAGGTLLFLDLNPDARDRLSRSGPSPQIDTQSAMG
jgi:CysZ protein